MSGLPCHREVDIPREEPAPKVVVPAVPVEVVRPVVPVPGEVVRPQSAKPLQESSMDGYPPPSFPF